MSRYDLVVLSADLDIEQVAKILLADRHAALGIRRPRPVFHRHAQKDPGCLARPEAVLGNPALADRALVLFDMAFDGAPSVSAEEMARQVEQKLRPIWGDRARAVAIEPEVEAWLWAGHHTAEALRWSAGSADLRRWLATQKLWPAGAGKPSDPKEALRRVLRQTSPGPTRGLFEHVASRASIDSCVDRSFGRLREILRSWFPASP